MYTTEAANLRGEVRKVTVAKMRNKLFPWMAVAVSWSGSTVRAYGRTRKIAVERISRDFWF